ncbi:hypothetical protein C2E23DRAFT_859586 [Lenzites betulinus]|nr:hypothetical protein C2E23DRAFT_859586 [Lenzites betulinus]
MPDLPGACGAGVFPERRTSGRESRKRPTRDRRERRGHEIGNDKSPPATSEPVQLTQSPTKESDMGVDEHGAKKKKERTNEPDACLPNFTLGAFEEGSSDAVAYELANTKLWEPLASLRALLAITPSPLARRVPPQRVMSSAKHSGHVGAFRERCKWQISSGCHPSAVLVLVNPVWEDILSFIVVRPPPSKSNHPLNLQVQLVPPKNREVHRSSSGRGSGDSSAAPEDDASEVQLTRTSSNRSDVSMYSSYSSTSISSVASSSTTSSGRRMIIPLYNLQAHNVLTNVIVDAGTDAKVAKFQKRGLEVIGLAVLEPVEVWGEGGNPAPFAAGNSPGAPSASLPDEHAPRASVDLSYSHLTTEPPHTPTSSVLSVTSDGMSDHPHTPGPVTPTPSSAVPTTPRNTPGAKKFFGKLFKRRGDSPQPSPTFPPSPLPPISAQPPSPAQPTTPLASADGHPSRRSSLLGNALSVPGHSASVSGSEAPVPGARESVILQPPVLGIQPSLSSPSFPPRGRPTKYVWVVRKWLKGTPESLLSGVKGKFNEARGTAPHASAVESLVEVRFEWTRGKSGRKHRSRRDTADEGADRTRSKRHSLALSSAAQSQTSLHQQPPQVHVSDPPQSKKRVASASAAEVRPRASIDSRRSTSPHATVSTTTSSDDHHKHSPSTTEDPGDESDPEDSETPWTCTLVVRRLSPSRLPPPGSPLPHAGASAGVAGSSTVRVKVAGVVPTPHHPKVVALLKVPFPLPDVEIERMNVRKRIITPAGVARPATSSGDHADAGHGSSNSANGKHTGSGMKNLFSGGKDHLGGGSGASAYPDGLILTAEEIKDIVSSTGLWLVVREGFGGVGRVSRRGDGWRLRG